MIDVPDPKDAKAHVGGDAKRPLPLGSLQIFLATRAEEIPSGCQTFLCVDGTVPGFTLRFDHHVSGERINLDALPDELPEAVWRFDGIGTTLPDADAVASVVAVLIGGKSRLPEEARSILESASHWCDHLMPHPGHDAAINRLGRGLLDYVATTLAGATGTERSARFDRLCRDLAQRVVENQPLPHLDTWRAQERKAAALDAAGRIERRGNVAVVDLRGTTNLDPLATYVRHRCPLALFVEDHPKGGRRYTVGTNPTLDSRPTDLGLALRALAAAEFERGAPARAPAPSPDAENWGGRTTVFGSPWNYGSRLSVDEVVALLVSSAHECGSG